MSFPGPISNLRIPDTDSAGARVDLQVGSPTETSSEDESTSFDSNISGLTQVSVSSEEESSFPLQVRATDEIIKKYAPLFQRVNEDIYTRSKGEQIGILLRKMQKLETNSVVGEIVTKAFDQLQTVSKVMRNLHPEDILYHISLPPKERTQLATDINIEIKRNHLNELLPLPTYFRGGTKKVRRCSVPKEATPSKTAKKSLEFDKTDLNGSLQMATRRRDVSTMKTILEQGNPSQFEKKAIGEALSMAVEENAADIVDILCEKYTKRIEEDAPVKALSICVEKGHKDCSAPMLTHLNKFFSDRKKIELLLIAARNGHSEIISQFLKVIKEIRNEDLQKLIDYLAEYGDDENIETALTLKKNREITLGTALRQATLFNHVNTVEKIVLAWDPKIDEPSHIFTALTPTCIHGYKKCFSLIYPLIKRVEKDENLLYNINQLKEIAKKHGNLDLFEGV